jgi:hypothetical protein
VHARRCSSVPCEKEGAGEAVADSKASDTRHRVKGVSRSSVHHRTCHPQSKLILIRADTNTLLPEPVLVANRQPL